MMDQDGIIRKMRVELERPVRYFFRVGDQEVPFNDLVGKHISLRYSGEIFCIKCGRKTSKSFAQGYCFPCFTTAPETEECVLRPELCQAHEGIARDMDFARSHCLIDHIVYLSLTSDVKVGVTRHTQVPVRWIDQGAVRALPIARTPNRHLAGQIEVALKKEISDKTNWRNMLKGKIDTNPDLHEIREGLATKLPDTLQSYISENEDITEISYPVLHYPEKIKSLNFDKQDEIHGELTGIKGQYLLFGDEVINIRKFGGYRIILSQ